MPHCTLCREKKLAWICIMRINEIHEMSMRRAQINHETYKILFNIACERIRRRAALHQGPTSLAFNIPPFVWGRPPYTRLHAVRYVSEKLRRNGFSVRALDEYTILVEWSRLPTKRKKQSKNRLKRQPEKPEKLSDKLAALRKLLS